MKRIPTLKNSLVSALALALAFAASATIASAEGSVNEIRDVRPDGVVSVENLAGSVTVKGWDQAQVEVTGTLADQVKELVFTTKGRRTTIQVDLPQNTRNVGDSDLIIRVPRESKVQVSTVSADIEASNVTGDLELESVSGSLTIQGRPAELEAASVSGAIEVEHAPSRCEVGSVSGDITIHGAEGDLEAGNVSGRIDVSGDGLDGAEVATVSGQVIFTTDLTGRGTFEVESVSGNITFEIPASASAEFDLSTFSGHIKSDLGPEPEKSGLGIPGEEVHFTQGSGGPSVILTSFSGSVSLVTR